MTGPDDVADGAVSDTAPEPDAEAVASAALSCAGVHGLTRGSDVVEIATYLPGRRVLGVRVTPGRAEVHIVTEYGANVVDVADRVRTAILAAVEDGTAPQVDIYVDDVAGPDDPHPSPDGQPQGVTSSGPEQAP